MDAKEAYYHACSVGRYPEGEAVIAKSGHWSSCYAEFVLRGRFPLGEAAIARQANSAYWYAINVLHGRFLEAEEDIMGSIYAEEYMKHFGMIEKTDWRKVGF